MKYLLDTNICVFFLRGKLDLDSIIKEKGRENCYVSEITAIENELILVTDNIKDFQNLKGIMMENWFIRT